MVKVDDLPEEQPRIELDKLAEFIEANGGEVEFISLGERHQEATEEKTGGLNLTLWTGCNFMSMFDIDEKEVVAEPVEYADGLRLTQKYSKISGRHLKEAMNVLGLEDTEEFKDAFYFYKYKAMRSGYGRLIPVRKSEKPPELPPN